MTQEKTHRHSAFFPFEMSSDDAKGEDINADHIRQSLQEELNDMSDNNLLSTYVLTSSENIKHPQPPGEWSEITEMVWRAREIMALYKHLVGTKDDEKVDARDLMIDLLHLINREYEREPEEEVSLALDAFADEKLHFYRD